MTTAIVLVLSLATIVVVLGAFVITARQGRVPAPFPQPPEEEPRRASPAVSPGDPDYFDPRTIKVGDTVYVESARYRAIGALYATMQGEQWTEYLLDEGARSYRWLSVEERPRPGGGDARHLEVLLWTDVPTQGMVPAKHMLIVDGMEFHPVERGTAAFRSEGVTGLPERGLLDFADYRAADGRLLSFQRVQGGQWEASYARPLTPGTIRVERLP
ncbi:hypothetical protein GCM10009530_30770 [Microbispora corallina]|uniref:DUF4178 domain-containing protein n=1 Tax=Microbispora corallina TaxID=83302 RepID=A0ABQ4G0U5_9ACTN|nr:DUF4178 domain-containing protein [Microbispora corallina]GIH40593.1 hypothetical protein Mco01_35930 [Microbispora corallina]